jgi:hypothetical protein
MMLQAWFRSPAVLGEPSLQPAKRFAKARRHRLLVEIVSGDK